MKQGRLCCGAQRRLACAIEATSVAVAAAWSPVAVAHGGRGVTRGLDRHPTSVGMEDIEEGWREGVRLALDHALTRVHE